MKILIANPALKIGGISSSLENWLIYLKEHTDHEIDLVLFDDKIDEKFKHLSEQVNIIPLHQFKSLRLSHKKWKHYSLYLKFMYCFVFLLRKLNLVSYFMRYIFKSYRFEKKYDLAVSYAHDIIIRQDYVLSNDFIEYSVNAKVKVAWIHSDIEKIGFTRKYILNRYKNYNYIVNVSPSCKMQLDTLVPEFEKKSLLISNPILTKKIKKQAQEPIELATQENVITFVTVARLAQAKRIDRLIEAASILNKKGHDFQWFVLGDGQGNILKETQLLAKENNVDEKLHFLGFKNNPYPYILKADYFVLTSDYEAQPMSVLESLTLSTPVVTTSIPIMEKYIEKNKNGFIVEKNATHIAQQLGEIIENKIYLSNFLFDYNEFQNEFLVLLDAVKAQ